MLIGCLLALELVDRPDAELGGRQPSDRGDLRVVRRDDEDIVEGQLGRV